MNYQEKSDLSKTIIQVIHGLQSDSSTWVDFARVGAPLAMAGVQYKQYGFPKLRTFLNEFHDVLDFKDEQLADGKPPVCYVRLKMYATCSVNTKVTIDKCSDSKANCSKKPFYDSEKSPLWALGFVSGVQTAIEFLANRTGVKLTQEELEGKIKASYDNGEIIYFEYDAKGNPVKSDSFSDHTAAFAVNTGVQDKNKHDIFAQYNKGHLGWKGVYFYTEEQIFNQLNSYKIGKLTFKNYDSANEFIKNLQRDLLPGETWKYAESTQAGIRKKTEFQILESYLGTVLVALFQEYDKQNTLNCGKIKFSQDNKYALFNTGLLNKYATDIIIIGEVYPKMNNANSRFTLSNPVILKRGKTELNEKGFNASDGDVDMISFFSQVSQIVYDATAEVDTDDIDKLHHCIDDGIKRNRFPQKCKEQYENGKLEDLTDTFKTAIRKAERIARRNYKYVVPQYRASAGENKIQFLMPIFMLSNYDNDKMPDFALVLSESSIENKKYYKPETVLELAWAYNNARVICKPDDMWLNPSKIKDAEEMEIEESN